MNTRKETTHIIVHTAAAGDPETGEVFDVSAEDIREFHVDELGWADIGYHYVIRMNGDIEKGRPEHLQGAHCTDMNMNERSIGICMSGHHDIQKVTQPQMESLISLIIVLKRDYGIPAGNVLGHRETGANKTCPGTKVNMKYLRWAVKELNVDHLQKASVDLIALAKDVEPNQIKEV